MQAACSHCGTEHVLRDADVGIHPRVQFLCSKCGKKTIVETKRRPDATMVISPLPSFARANSSGSSLNLLQQDDGAKLPELKHVVLTVISGPGKGGVHRLTKARVVIGREGADIALTDPEISRHHSCWKFAATTPTCAILIRLTAPFSTKSACAPLC